MFNQNLMIWFKSVSIFDLLSWVTDKEYKIDDKLSFEKQKFHSNFEFIKNIINIYIHINFYFHSGENISTL